MTYPTNAKLFLHFYILFTAILVGFYIYHWGHLFFPTNNKYFLTLSSIFKYYPSLSITMYYRERSKYIVLYIYICTYLYIFVYVQLFLLSINLKD